MSEIDVPEFPGCKVKFVRMQRVTIVGPKDKANEVFDSLCETGFRVTRSGPYTDKQMHPTVDVTRFLFIAERVVDQEG